jgi:hypothetical protein
MTIKNGMKRRTRITLALAALTTFAFGATYGLVAHEGVVQQPTFAAIATQTVAESTATPAAQNSGSIVEQDNGGSSQETPTPTAPVPHATTRAT